MKIMSSIMGDKDFTISFDKLQDLKSLLWNCPLFEFTTVFWVRYKKRKVSIYFCKVRLRVIYRRSKLTLNECILCELPKDWSWKYIELDQASTIVIEHNWNKTFLGLFGYFDIPKISNFILGVYLEQSFPPYVCAKIK